MWPMVESFGEPYIELLWESGTWSPWLPSSGLPCCRVSGCVPARSLATPSSVSADVAEWLYICIFLALGLALSLAGGGDGEVRRRFLRLPACMVVAGRVVRAVAVGIKAVRSGVSEEAGVSERWGALLHPALAWCEKIPWADWQGWLQVGQAVYPIATSVGKGICSRMWVFLI